MTWASEIIKTEMGLSPERLKRWQGFMKPYAELPEADKDKDRRLAAQYIDAFLMQPMLNIRQEILKNMPDIYAMKSRVDDYSRGFVEGVERSAFIVRHVFDVYGFKEPETKP